MTGDLHIPFHHEHRDGTVAVRIRRVADATEAGFDVLPNLPFGPDAAVGYPSMSAALAYEGEGYRQLMGWVQIVHSVRSWGDGRVVTASEVDRSPAWYDVDIPFFTFGYAPSIYDAPARNRNGARHLDWRADTFLTTVPRRTRSEPIRRLASFRWGYTESDTETRPPALAVPEETTAAAWERSLGPLQQQFPQWSWA